MTGSKMKLVIMDHNGTLDNKQIGNKPQFSKATTDWILKNKFAKSTKIWKHKIMEKIEQFYTDINIEEINSVVIWANEVNVPDCIGSVFK